jgi:tRNA1Val (adenine37-N6)-methyltransferase
MEREAGARRDVAGDVTKDAMLGGRIRIYQEKRGYRFSVDAVLLSFFAQAREPGRALDLGTGCGIVPLLLAHRYPRVEITGVEIQPRLAALAEKNIRANGRETQVRILAGDLRKLPFEGVPKGFDLVVANPPYRRMGTGLVNPDGQRAMARHEIHADLAEVVACARRMLKHLGKFAVVYPAERLAEVMHAMRSGGVEPKRLRLVHNTAEAPATLLLCEGARGAGPDLRVQAPLVIYERPGVYTRDASEMLYSGGPGETPALSAPPRIPSA